MIDKEALTDDNDYKIWGVHFFNRDAERMKEFRKDMAEITEHALV